MEKETESDLRELTVRLRRLRTGDDGTEDHAELRELGARHLRCSVTRGDVRDLVAQDAGQLVFGVDALEHAARDVDVAARKRHRVDHRRVDDGEVPRQMRTIRCRSDALADGIDEPIELRLLVVNAELTDHFLVRLLTDLDFLALGDDVEFALVCDRIRGAGGEEKKGGNQRASHAGMVCKGIALKESGHPRPLSFNISSS